MVPAWPPRPGFQAGRIAFSGLVARRLAGAGITLAELFDAQIGADPDILRLIDHASGSAFADRSTMAEPIPYFCDPTAILDRAFLQHQPAWPVSLERYDLVVEWCDSGGSRFATIEPTERRGRLAHLSDFDAEDSLRVRQVVTIARIVQARYVAMIGCLRSGELEAFGRLNGSAMEARIGFAVWSTPSNRVLFGENEIRRLDGDPVMRPEVGPVIRRENLSPVWSDVIVRRPVQTPQAVVTTVDKKGASISKVKNKGGRLQEYPWEDAFDRLTVRSWDQPRPETGVKLIAQMVECLEEAGYPEPNDEYVKWYLSTKHETLWQACIKKQNPSRKPHVRRGR